MKNKILLVGNDEGLEIFIKQEKEEKDENYHMVERRYGSFSRSVHLPHEVKIDKIKANYKVGILKITLPKSEEAKKKEVKIKVE